MEKVARICWNTRDWKRPSGSIGKSTIGYTYESKQHFGHEEWLLDDSKVMPDGYHYGFLEPLNVKSDIHIGKKYDIHLYTINSIYKKKEYVGCLRNAECISPKKAEEIYRYYKKQGWLREMKEDIRYAGGIIQDIVPRFLFNVRFKLSEAEINNSNRPVIAENDPNTKCPRYILMNKCGEFNFERDEEGHVLTLNTDPYTVTVNNGEIIVDPLHKRIQCAIYEILKDQYEHLYLEKGEKSLSAGQRIDMKGKYAETGEWHYFEIKTASAKQSIREALGQILEYAMYDHRSSRASKLFIVGPEQPDEKDKAYMQKLREQYELPVWFRWFSFQDNKLHEGI